MNIKWIGTPDFTKGRKSYDYIVMHWGVTNSLSQIDAEVLNPNREMSYHYALSDDTVHQYVKEENTAWHAGVWDINQRSIGICINASPTNPYTDKDYETAAQLCAEIVKRHGIGVDNIKGHKDFKATQCPGTLDFNRLKARVNQINANGGNVDLLTELNNCKSNLTLNEKAVADITKESIERGKIIDIVTAESIARGKTIDELKATIIANKEKAILDLATKQKKIDELEQAIKDKDISKLGFWQKITILFS